MTFKKHAEIAERLLAGQFQDVMGSEVEQEIARSQVLEAAPGGEEAAAQAISQSQALAAPSDAEEPPGAALIWHEPVYSDVLDTIRPSIQVGAARAVFDIIDETESTNKRTKK